MQAKWGQHYLISSTAVNKIVSTLNPQDKDVIIEIGPGKGILTEQLANRVKLLIGIEIDTGLCNLLNSKFRRYSNVHIINQNFLNWDYLTLNQINLPWNEYNPKFIGNIPYYITSPIIQKLVLIPNWTTTVLTVQEEVAQRIVAKPGNKKFGILSIAVQLYCTAELILKINRTCFHPIPQVNSAVLKLTRLSTPLLNPEDEPSFFRLIRTVFQQRRKYLVNTLSRICTENKSSLTLVLQDLNLSPHLRPEEIAITDFLKLYTRLKTFLTPKLG